MLLENSIESMSRKCSETQHGLFTSVRLVDTKNHNVAVSMVNRSKSRFDQDLNPVVEEDKDAMDMFDSNASGDEQDAKGE